MKNIIVTIFLSVIYISCKTPLGAGTNKTNSMPALVAGNFTDDYSIRYTINDSLWVQHPNIKYHIIQWNSSEQYLLAKNDNNNPSEAGLYTRIDYMTFQNMEPYKWGFCLTVYNAKTKKEAVTKAQADRQNPRKGCGGFPFSRMKKTE
jgi:hypothetical protein